MRLTTVRHALRALVALGVVALPAVVAAQTAGTKVLSSGNGWRILEVTDYSKSTQPSKRVWMVNKNGVNSLPVSQFQKDELNVDFQTPDAQNAVIFVTEEMAFGVEQGQLPPGYEEYQEMFNGASPGGADGADPDAPNGCFGWNDKTYSKSYTYAPQGIDKNFNLGNGITGNFMANIPLNGNANLFMRYRIKKFACVPYKFKFVDARLWGALNVAGHGALSASASITGHWEKEWLIAEPQIGSFTIWIGPVPVQFDVSLPIHAGLSLDISIMGTVSATPDFGAYGTFDYTCNPDTCTGTNTFTENFDLNNLNASVTLDIDAKAHARVMGKVAIYDDSIAYVQGGLKGLAIAELWGYTGNTCGDADGNGSNESVQALAADLSWGYDIVWGIGGFLLPDRTWTSTGPRYPLFWKDLLGAGGSTALQPMLLGPSSVAQNTSASYTVKMRPCYPYTHQVNFSLTPGTWTGTTNIPQPKSTNPSLNSSTLSRSFPTAGPLTLTVKNTVDGFNRNIQVPYSRTINVSSATPSAPSNLTATVLSPTSVRLNWTDNSTNETGFEVHRRTLPSGTFALAGTVGANATTWTNNGLTASTGYEFKVRAMNGTNASAFSNTVAATTPAGVTITTHPANRTVAEGASTTLTVAASGTAPITYQWEHSTTSATSGFSNVVNGNGRSGATTATLTINPAAISHAGWYRARVTDAYSTAYSNAAQVTVTVPTCVSNSATLCLQSNRFRVRLTAASGTPTVKTYGNESGFFTLFAADNIEVGVKILDGTASNGKWWVYHGSLTTVQYTLTVVDTVADTQKTYTNNGTMCGGGDTGAFGPQAEGGPTTESDTLMEGGIMAPFDVKELDAEGPETDAPTACTPNSTTACLLGSRFKVQVLRGGAPQTAVPFTDKTALFWFFNSGNIEIPVKVLDGTASNGRYWVFYGSLTSQAYQVVVTDTVTGASKTYNSGAAHCGVADTAAFLP